MAITIPQAGTIAGRSASIQVPQPETGGLIAEFGNRMLEKGMAWKKAQDDAAILRDTVAATRDMGEARLRAEQISDPAQIGPAWETEVGSIREKYITPDTPPEVAAALDLAITDLEGKHGLKLGEKVINLTQSQQQAVFIEALDQITTTAATADPTTFAALGDIGVARIDAEVAAGRMDPATAAQEKIKLRQGMYSNRAATALQADPAAFLAAAEAGEYDALGGDGITSFKLAAQQELDRRAAAAAKAAEADAKKREDAIGARLDVIADGAQKGRVVEDEAYMNAPEIMAHPKWAKAKAMVELRKEVPSLDVMTPAQLDGLIKAEEQRPITETWENERLTVLKGMRDKKTAAYATDPKSAAAASSLPAPALPDFDPADPAPFAAALSESLSFDSYLKDQGYSDRSAVMTADERARLKAVIDPRAEAAPKVALAEAILSGAGDKAGQVLAEVDADPVFRRGVKVLGLTGDRALTEAIMRGGQKVADKTAILPPRKEQLLIFDQMTGGVFEDAPAVKAEVMDAALALYADGAAGIDGETQAAEGWIEDGAAYTLYQQSVQRLLGAQPDRSGKLTIGGLQEVNGSLVPLPPGVSAAAADDAMDRLGKQLMGGRFRAEGEAYNYGSADYSAQWDFSNPTDDAARFAPFKAASLYGGLPDLGADPATAFSTLGLRRVGETDVYEFTYERSGRLYAVPMQGTDRAYRFRLTDLLREAGK